MSTALKKELTAKLLDIARTDENAKKLFTFFSQRERSTPETDLKRLKNIVVREGVKLSYSEILSFFTKLEKTGVGELRGDRFFWGYDLVAVASAVVTGRMPSLRDKEPETPPAEKGVAIPTPMKSRYHITVKPETGEIDIFMPEGADPKEFLAMAREILKTRGVEVK